MRTHSSLTSFRRASFPVALYAFIRGILISGGTRISFSQLTPFFLIFLILMEKLSHTRARKVPKRFQEDEPPVVSSATRPRRVTKPKAVSPKKRRATLAKTPASKTKKRAHPVYFSNVRHRERKGESNESISNYGDRIVLGIRNLCRSHERRRRHHRS